MKTTSKWISGQQFETFQEEFSVKLDGTRENGFSPKALLLSGLAACTGIDVVDILEKMRVNFSDFSVDAEAEQTEEHPKVFKEMMLTYKIHADKADEGKIIKAINLSLDKYCGVAAMLKKNNDIIYKLTIF
jgi:putative redox protein